MKFWNKTPVSRVHTIGYGALILALFSIFSKALGLIRYSLIASRFGTGPVADSYMAAFRVPDFIYNALVLGALSTAFIPVFLDLYNKQKPKKEVPIDLGVEASEEGLSSVNIDHRKNLGSAVAEEASSLKRRKFRFPSFQSNEPHWDLTNSVLNLLVIILLLVAAIAWVFTPEIVLRLVPGFDQERVQLTIRLTRIMLLSPLLFAISNVLGSVLQSFQRFTWFALAPVMYNVGILFGIVALYPLIGPTGLAWGVVCGTLLHLAVQFPGVVQLGYSWRPVLGLRIAGMKRVFSLIIPRALALSANQINHIVNTALASGLAAGSVVIFYNAYDLKILPISLVAVSLAVASFPVLGELYVHKQDEEFSRVISEILRKVLFAMIPLSLFMILLRAQIVRLILGYGLYNWNDTIETLELFGVMSIAVVAQGLIPVLARAFYARENTKTPVLISLIAVVTNVVMALILVWNFRLVGLGIAYVISSYVQALLLVLFLERQVSRSIVKTIVKYGLIYSGVAFVAGAALYITLYMVAATISTNRVWSLFVQAFISSCVGAGVYVLVLHVFGDEVVKSVWAKVNFLIKKF